MIVESFALEIVKYLNLLVDWALGEGSNGTFEADWNKEKPFSH